MKILGILLVAAAPAFAGDMIARQGSDEARFTDKPCTNATILANPLVSAPENWRAATAFFQGQHYEACWQSVGGMYHLVYEDGDQGFIPLAEIEPVLEI